MQVRYRINGMIKQQFCICWDMMISCTSDHLDLESRVENALQHLMPPGIPSLGLKSLMTPLFTITQASQITRFDLG